MVNKIGIHPKMNYFNRIRCTACGKDCFTKISRNRATVPIDKHSKRRLILVRKTISLDSVTPRHRHGNNLSSVAIRERGRKIVKDVLTKDNWCDLFVAHTFECDLD